jgi:predicted CoA-binding protein
MPSDRIRRFYEADSYAVIGVSRKRRNFARLMIEELRKRGKRAYGVGLEKGRFDGLDCYESVDSLPERPEAVVICTGPKYTQAILNQVSDLGARSVWLQQGSHNEEILAHARNLNIDALKGCVLMYMPGASFPHRLHRAILELFGKGYR